MLAVLLGSSASAAAARTTTAGAATFADDVPAFAHVGGHYLCPSRAGATLLSPRPEGSDSGTWWVSGSITTPVARSNATKVDEIVGAACSFSGETRVLMADGTTKPISEIEVGDEVLAYDPETGERGPRKVTHLWVHEDTLLELELGGARVETTEDHPFWNVTDRAWQQAGDLDLGDRVLSADGQTLAVGGLDMSTTFTGSAHNLTVEDIHTYFVQVGDVPILVHNDNTCSRALWSLTTDGASRTATHGRFGKFYQSASDGTWWVKDTAGHGGSAFKVYEETSTGLQWIADADEFGTYIVGKHKSSTGAFIPWKELAG
jgi:hypothetical protein